MDSQSTPQLDPNFDYAKLPDGSFAKFPKGTHPDTIRAKLESAGLIKAKPAENQLPAYWGFTPENVAKNAREGAKGMIQGTYQLGKDLVNNPNWLSGKDSTAQKFVFGPADEQVKKAVAEWNTPGGSKIAAGGHALAALIPFLGPMAANLGEQAGRGDVGGATGQLLGMGAVTGVAKLATKGAQSYTDPVKNQAIIAKLNQHALKMAEGGIKDPAAFAAIRVAKEGIHGNIESVYKQLHEAVRGKDVPKEQAAQMAVAKGVRMPQSMGPEMVQALTDLKANSAMGGTLTTGDVAELNKFIEQLRFKADPVTGKPTSIRDWNDFREVYNLTRTGGLLSQEAEFNKQRPDIVNNAARRLRGIAVNKIGEVAPDVGRLSREQSELVKAREAANDMVVASRKGNAATFRGIMSSNAPTLAAWIAARELLGMQAAVALGGVIVFKRLAESVSSRTLRAALRAKLLERQQAALQGVSGPTGGSASGSAIQPQGGPQVLPGQRLTGAPAAPPATAPATPGTATVLPRGTMLPKQATRARAGSGNYTRLSGAESTASTGYGPTKPYRGGLPIPDDQLGHPPAAEDIGVKVRPQTEKEQGPIQRDADKNKTMLQRLSTIIDRQADPKETPMSKAALKRERAEIEAMLKGENLGTKHSGAPKRIADRERLATQRAADAAQLPAVGTPSPGGVAPPMDAEQRVMQLDMGYKALATFEGGPDMVKALQKLAKELKGTEYDELEQLKQSVKALIDAGERPK